MVRNSQQTGQNPGCLTPLRPALSQRSDPVKYVVRYACRRVRLDDLTDQQLQIPPSTP